jgi:hypothetical protein
MVWGLELASDFGPFFPYGEFFGFEQQLEAAFDVMMPEEKTYYNSLFSDYRFHVYQCFKHEIGTIHGEGKEFRAIADNEWPTEFRTKKQYSKIGALFKGTSQVLMVRGAFKEIVERLEPGVHRFWPIRLTYVYGDAYPGDYFTMIIGTFLSSFDVEQSTPGTWRTVGRSYHPKFFNKEMMSGVAMRKSAIGTHHLWRERALKSPDTFLSDELQAEFRKANLSLPKHFRMKEV